MSIDENDLMIISDLDWNQATIVRVDNVSSAKAAVKRRVLKLYPISSTVYSKRH